MKKRTVNPWRWQDERSYSQAVEVSNVTSTLYVSGQTAIDAMGVSSDADMETQLKESLKNLEEVVVEAGYECSNIVRIDLYTTDQQELLPHFPIFQQWVDKHDIKTTLTFLEVKCLFETLKVELEVIVVK